MSLSLNNKTSFDILRREIEAAVASVATKHGLNMKTDGISYERHGGECTIKLKCTTKEQPKAVANEHVSMLDMYGLKGYYQQRVRTHDGQIFIVAGINSRCRKSPVILERPNGGRGAKCPVDYILNRCTKVGDAPKVDAMKVEPGTLTMVPAPGTIFGTAREIAGGRMWTIHHEGCNVDANFFSGRLPKQHAIVKCNCGQSVQITEALTFEDQL